MFETFAVPRNEQADPNSATIERVSELDNVVPTGDVRADLMKLQELVYGPKEVQGYESEVDALEVLANVRNGHSIEKANTEDILSLAEVRAINRLAGFYLDEHLNSESSQ